MPGHTHLHHLIVLSCCCWSQTLQASWAASDNIFTESYIRTTETSQAATVSESSSETSMAFPSLPSCYDESEALNEHEDVRTELMAINMRYLENGSIKRACQRDGKASDCKLDFNLYPSNLHEACEKYGGRYAEREHSIQCRNSATEEELYYQFDHFPSCFAPSCDTVDVNKMISTQLDGVRRAMEEHSGMHCLSDWEILEYASEMYESTGSHLFGRWVTLTYYSGLGLGVFLLFSF
jgi:hypothetical protein